MVCQSFAFGENSFIFSFFSKEEVIDKGNKRDSDKHNAADTSMCLEDEDACKQCKRSSDEGEDEKGFWVMLCCNRVCQ